MNGPRFYCPPYHRYRCSHQPGMARLTKTGGSEKFTVMRRPGLYTDAVIADGDSVCFVDGYGTVDAFDFSSRCPWGPSSPAETFRGIKQMDRTCSTRAVGSRQRWRCDYFTTGLNGIVDRGI